MALRLQKSRVCFKDTKLHFFGASFNIVAFFASGAQKRLTYKIIAPTMQLLTCTYVFVDKK